MGKHLAFINYSLLINNYLFIFINHFMPPALRNISVCAKCYKINFYDLYGQEIFIVAEQNLCIFTYAAVYNCFIGFIRSLFKIKCLMMF